MDLTTNRGEDIDMTLTEDQFPKTAAPTSKLNIARIVQAFIGSKAEQRHVGGIVTVVVAAVFHKSLGTSPTVLLGSIGGTILALESVGEHFGLKL
jgi:hypothetical protein